MNYQKALFVIGGGTVSHVRGHLALCAPAYGTTARQLAPLCGERFTEMSIHLRLSALAAWGGGEGAFETNEELRDMLDDIVSYIDTKVIFMNAAVCDFDGSFPGGASGKHEPRISTRNHNPGAMTLTPAEKLLPRIRKDRKDIFLVAFKETSGATEDEQYLAALTLCKESSANLVLANDIATRNNLIVTPEEARYCSTTDREKALTELVDMAWHRSHLTFTRSTVVAGEPVPWSSPLVPSSLRAVINYCINRGAYKPIFSANQSSGVTAGHFAVALDEKTFLTSIRKTNFNNLAKTGLVKVETDGPDSVIAYGSKPSVGGQSQRIVFHDHPMYDCIVHFHCPKKPSSSVPTVSQREYECGSHECGQNTSRGLEAIVFEGQPYGRIEAVYLDNHGPNIVFNRRINPRLVIDFIEENFDLSEKTGGYTSAFPGWTKP